MRIALVANGAWYLVNFRRGLIQKLIDLGHDVVCICPQDDYLPGLIELGVSWKQWDLSRRGMNPLVERKAIRRLAAVRSAGFPASASGARTHQPLRWSTIRAFFWRFAG